MVRDDEEWYDLDAYTLDNASFTNFAPPAQVPSEKSKSGPG